MCDPKLQSLAEEATKTWKWAEACLDVDYDSFLPYGRVCPGPLDPDPELQAELAKLQERQDALESEYDEETWREELQEEEQKIWDRKVFFKTNYTLQEHLS
ncbi:MAG: hypothetical protein ACSHXD_19885 [Marinosulfonomonas sp.]